MVYSEDWGKLIHEKNQKSKISWHCPFKGTVALDDFFTIVGFLECRFTGSTVSIC
jgi:hypothetical protein